MKHSILDAKVHFLNTQTPEPTLRLMIYRYYDENNFPTIYAEQFCTAIETLERGNPNEL